MVEHAFGGSAGGGQGGDARDPTDNLGVPAEHGGLPVGSSLPSEPG